MIGDRAVQPRTSMLTFVGVVETWPSSSQTDGTRPMPRLHLVSLIQYLDRKEVINCRWSSRNKLLSCKNEHS